MAEKKDNVPSTFKDNVFCMLYRDKKNLLELYNALNNSAYTNVDDLQVTTLNGGSYMKYKNDASFLLCMSLYMFEQQSSKNPNMPLRFLHYVSDVFRELFSNSMLHRRSMIKIPVPHFVTFYNGLENGLKMRMKSGCQICTRFRQTIRSWSLRCVLSTLIKMYISLISAKRCVIT